MASDPPCPTADQVATAIVTAARLTGEDPLLFAISPPLPHCRLIAYAALRDAFPDITNAAKARALGWPASGMTTTHASANVQSARTRAWWREEFVDEVVGVLVADQYGERAL